MLLSLQGKIPSFSGTEFTDGDELQEWRATLLEAFFAECPHAFDEFKGQVYMEFQILKAKAKLAAIDDAYRQSHLAEYESGACLAIFNCFRPNSKGELRCQIAADHLGLCEADYLPDLIPFRDTFWGWLGKYNLAKCVWVQSALLDSLRDLDTMPFLFKDGYRADRNRAGFQVQSVPFKFEFRGFILNGEYLESYRSELEAQFRDSLAKHVLAFEALAEERGLKRAKDKDAIHYIWLVQHVCLGKPFRSFRAKGRRDPSPDKVSKAVNRLAKVLGIDVPKGQRGRPKEI